MNGTVTGNYGWARWAPNKLVPGWFGAEDQGAGIAIADINGDGRPDLLVFHVDNPNGENHGYYRIGWDMNTNGTVIGGWSNVKPVPGWFGVEDQGAGVAIADVNGNGRPDLLVFHVDNPNGENHGYYRIGWNLDANGDVTGGWSNIKPVPGWFGAENQGADIAVVDISQNGQYDLVVFHLDNPGGENFGYYRIGWNLDANGDVTGGWSNVKSVPGWFGAENQGAGIAAFRYYGDNCFVIAHVDNPAGNNTAYYRISTINQNGDSIAGWTNPIRMPAPIGWETHGVAVATGYIAGNYHPDLVTFFVDNPAGDNHGYYFFADILVGVP